jgi:hypothetical protein
MDDGIGQNADVLLNCSGSWNWQNWDPSLRNEEKITSFIQSLQQFPFMELLP